MKNIKFGGGIIVVLLAVLIGGWLFLLNNNDHIDQPVACTEEAKICPDGSAVGRTEPNCEFALCPSEIEDRGDLDDDRDVIVPTPVKWVTYTDDEWKYSFEYPNNYALEEKRAGFEIIISPEEGFNGKTDFFSVMVLQYPDIDEEKSLLETLFNQANLPDGSIAWLRDFKFYNHEDYLISFEEIAFGVNDSSAIKSREKSINDELGEYRSIVYVLRDPAIYRVTHDLIAEQTHGEIIERIEDSFTVLE